MLKQLKALFAKPYRELSPMEAFQMMREERDLVVLDVRSISEFNSGKIKGARQMDVMQSNFETLAKGLPKEKTYLVYCRSGMRSARASKILCALGFPNVINLRGGYMNWQSQIN